MALSACSLQQSVWIKSISLLWVCKAAFLVFLWTWNDHMVEAQLEMSTNAQKASLNTEKIKDFAKKN